jgi:hypothetical protein
LKIQKLGVHAEQKNAILRRVYFKLINIRRGGIQATLTQTQKIINNMVSRIHKKSPLEAARDSTRENVNRYNKARQKGNKFTERKLKVGDRVRINTRNFKDIMYKSNVGTQWSKKLFRIEKVGTVKPFKYMITMNVKVKNIKKRVKKWFTSDKLQVLPADDQISKKLVENRLQSGAIKSTYAKKPPSDRVPKRRPPSTRIKYPRRDRT